MKIKPCYYVNTSQQYKNQKHLTLNSIKKCDMICFKSRDLLSLPEQDILDKIGQSITPENFLGQGTEAEVYKIKDTNYCVRIPYFAENLYKSNFSKQLSPIDKLNHIVARLGFGATIIKYFEGVTPKLYMNNSHERYKFQEKIAEMPIKSYSELLHQIADAIDNEMLFDYSPGNLIVDTKNQKLTAIDFLAMSEVPRPIRPMCEMYSALTSYGTMKTTGNKIFNKIIDAGLEEFKPNTIPCMDVELFDFIDLCIKRENENFPQKNSYDFIKNLQTQFNELKKLKKTEIKDKKYSTALERQINTLKNIIRYIK